MSKTYEVCFSKTALPGVRAVGTIQRGDSVKVDAAEAVRLVDAKGLAFASAADDKAARQELAGAAQPDIAVVAPAADTTEEH
jgi:hypothetical protein